MSSVCSLSWLRSTHFQKLVCLFCTTTAQIELKTEKNACLEFVWFFFFSHFGFDVRTQYTLPTPANSVEECPLWDWQVVGLIPSQVTIKTVKMVPIPSLLGTQYWQQYQTCCTLVIKSDFSFNVCKVQLQMKHLFLCINICNTWTWPRDSERATFTFNSPTGKLRKCSLVSMVTNHREGAEREVLHEGGWGRKTERFCEIRKNR